MDLNLQKLNSWPFEEAKKILKKINNKTPKKGYVLFQTGFGPSGLPHIGTFGEVSRTVCVINAFKILTDNKIPTKLIVFSDDLDGMRKVPSNVPNQEMLNQDLNKALTSVRDPFEKFESFAHHNNDMLCKFLDNFGFEYELYSATNCYKTGLFNDTLKKVIQNYEAILDIMLPTLGEIRAKTYSPFMPVCQKTNKVLQVKIENIDKENFTVSYVDENNNNVTTSILDGNCKLQWKPDWAMRWVALGVDYEMCGKDLQPSFDVSEKIAKAIDGKAPCGLIYELFLDKDGGKISKSKGNGLSIEEWLKYAPDESLSYFMFQKPKTAKKLYFGVIPKSMDEYITTCKRYIKEENQEQKFNSPIYHIHGDNPPLDLPNVSFSLLMNLVSAVSTPNKEVIMDFVKKYETDLNQEKEKIINSMLDYVINYYKDYIEPEKQFKTPNDMEKSALITLMEGLNQLGNTNDGKLIQSVLFDTAAKFELSNNDWFQIIYQVVLGQTEGPKMGGFIKLYGVENFANLIKQRIC